MLLDLAIREGALFENAVAELVGCRIEMATLQFSPEGLSLTVEDCGNIVAALRILAGGCDFFRCSESCSGRLNIETLLHILFEANNGKSALSISIDPREEDFNEKYNPDEPNLSPATLKVVWFDPFEDADQENQEDYCDMNLHVGEAGQENELLKYDESEYLLKVGISAPGFDTLFSKLKEVRAEDNRNRPYGEIKVMVLINNSSLGFISCRQGWVHKEEGGIEINWEEDFGICMGMYDFAFLCKRIFTAEEVGAYKMFFHIQDMLPNLLRCPLGSGELGDLYFYSIHSRFYLRVPSVNVLTYRFLEAL